MHFTTRTKPSWILCSINLRAANGKVGCSWGTGSRSIVRLLNEVKHTCVWVRAERVFYTYIITRIRYFLYKSYKVSHLTRSSSFFLVENTSKQNKKRKREEEICTINFLQVNNLLLDKFSLFFIKMKPFWTIIIKWNILYISYIHILYICTYIIHTCICMNIRSFMRHLVSLYTYAV